MNIAELIAEDVSACASLANFVASDFVESLSAASGVSSLSIAASPSVALVHNHLPTRNVVVGCAYCERHGNVFEAPSGSR